MYQLQWQYLVQVRLHGLEIAWHGQTRQAQRVTRPGRRWSRGCDVWACGQASGLSICPCRALLVHGVKNDHLVSIWMPKMRTASPLFPGWRAKPTRVAITSKMMRRYACFMPLIILSRPEKALRLNFAGGYLLIQMVGSRLGGSATWHY